MRSPRDPDPLSRRSVRQALRAWDSSPRLGQHPLATLEMVEVRRQAAGYRATPVGRGVALRDLLRTGIEALGRQDTAARGMAILRGLYLEGRSAAYLCDRLGIARSTYDHGHATALDALANQLHEWAEAGLPADLRVPSGPPPTPAVPFLAPPLPAHPLIGRESLLEACRERLLSRRLLVLTGLPGAGKTALALALAHDPAIRQAYPDGVLWSGLGQSPDLAARVGAWAVALGWSLEALAGIPTLEDRARLLQAALSGRRMLLVLDDVWAPEHARALQLGGEDSAELVTTRLPVLANELASDEWVTVPELDTDAGRSLLSHFAPLLVEAGARTAERFVEAVGGLPLALVLVGRHLRAEGRLAQSRRLEAALHRLAEPRARMDLVEPRPALQAQPSLPLDASISLRTVLALSEAALNEAARRMLAELAIFPPKPNTFSEAAALAVSNGRPADLDALLDAGLAEPVGVERRTLHPTIADYAATLGDPTQAGQRLVAFLVALPSRHAEALASLAIDEANVVAALSLAKLKGWTADLRLLMHAWFPYFEATGHLSSVLPFLEAAVVAAREANAPQEALEDLARAELQLGHYADAAAHAAEGLALARAASERGDECVFLKILGLGAAAQGQYLPALALWEQGLATAEAAELAAEQAALLANMGSILAKQGHPDQAEARTRQALARARTLGDQRLEGTLLANLGVLAAQRGDLAQADPLFLEALELARARGARGIMAALLTNLGTLAHDGGDEAAAEAHFHEGLAIAREISDPALQAQLLANLGRVAAARGAVDEAEALYQEGLNLARRTGHRENLALLLINAGALARLRARSQEAKALLVEAVALSRDIGHERYAAAAEAELAQL